MLETIYAFCSLARRYLVITASLFFLAAPSQIHAQEKQTNVTILGGEHLAENCSNDDNPVWAGFCIGYIRAAFDAMYVEASAAHYVAPDSFPDPIQCVPKFVSNDTIMALVKDFLKNDPAAQETFAYESVRRAIRQAFPSCFVTVPKR